MTALKLVIVTSRFPFGGHEAFLGPELDELAKHFEKVVLVPVRPVTSLPRRPLPDRVEVLGWPLIGAALVRRAALMVRRHPDRALRAVSSVIRSRDRGRVKNLTVILKALALADWVIEHEFGHIHSYWMSTPATVAHIAAAASGVPWSATAHRWDIYERNAFDVKERSAAFVRTISARGTADLEARMPRLEQRVRELRLGALVPPLVDARSRGPEFHIVSPAALIPRKGHADLLAAVAELRALRVPVRCTLCGTGPLRRTLESRAAALGIADAIEFAGFVPQATLQAWYREGRFAVVALASRADKPSERMEGVPAAVIEAMAFGIPVVATDSGSVCELLDDECGRLVRPEDSHALALALYDVYCDFGAAEMRARRAHQRVVQLHDARVQMRELAALICGERLPA
jgi:glycosyltransferase involved in cell wall biosynthesis